jgi:murein L,D-transpeptidase YcbB/YkuD
MQLLSARLPFVFLSLLFAAIISLGLPSGALAQVTAFKQAVAEAASKDRDIAAFYKANGYKGIWTGEGTDRKRRAALIEALDNAVHHGLPAARYDVPALEAQMKTARSPRDLGLLEVAMSRVFLTYARDVQTGVLVPSRVDAAMVRQVPYRDRQSYLTNLAKSSPKGFFKALPPQSAEYTGLMKQKIALEQLLSRGGWGPSVPGKTLKPGASGQGVVALRNRLVEMGFLNRSASQTYDSEMTAAVQEFQRMHGLEQDGVAGPGTMAEINTSVQSRLQSVIVAMERERWLNMERGARHVEVNLTDFTAKIVDNGKVSFSTRSVIGARANDRQSPEFSDVMEFMVINPSWYVPRSIVTKEYLPQLQQNPNAVSHIEITDSRGRQVDRSAVDFTQFSARSFPFAMRQPPSRRNALGLVKFMFPNPHNIYLHDTPAKNLFGREVRAYSHGCIRLADPFDFAYALLARQTADPKGFFKSKLSTGKEQTVTLDQPVPVHIIYRTALIDARGRVEYRRDIYGRDGKIWEALSKAGVALRAVQG